MKDHIPGTEEKLNEGSTTGYVGFDPTAPSLTVGNLVPIMLLVHFQRAGHKPIALVGGATGMIGDPSGKDKERQLLDEETLNENVERIKEQLSSFLNFDEGDLPAGQAGNKAELINNIDFYKDMEIFEFFRDIGKHLTVSYMTAKDSVKNRVEEGMSFTEFAYQLFQGYDFLWLYKNKNCIFQMGGSDQWGNITSGAELIRRKEGGKAFALTCPLLTKSDGTKFGKSEDDNIWLDPRKTSPYKFYQFWLNSTDDDAIKYSKIFSTKSKKELQELGEKHLKAPHERLIQKELAKEITIRVHSENDLQTAIAASEILFGKGTAEALKELSEESLLDIFEGVPQSNISKGDIENGIGIVEFLADKTDVLASKGEARRSISGGGISINKAKIESEDYSVDSSDLLNDKYILVQKGKKNYHLVTII